MIHTLAAVEVDGDSVQLRRFAVVVVNRLLLVNRAVLVAPGQRFAAHAQHVVVRKRDIAIEIVADDAIGANLPIGIVAVSIKRVLAVVARVRLVGEPQKPISLRQQNLILLPQRKTANSISLFCSFHPQNT